MNMRTKTRLLAFLMVLLGLTVKAQETTSEIQGVVTGSTVLTGATVTAVHLPTGTRYATTTRKDGRYNIANARVGGPYSVTVSYVGYKEQKQEDIFLTLGTAYKADFTLATNETSLTEVVVAGRRSDKVFSRSRTGSAEVITRQQIDRLPTINRSLQDYTRLTPSANGTSFGGRSSSYNNLTVNGASFNNTFGLSGTLGGQTSSQPFSLDALEQIQVNLAPYDVTLGGFTGAGINSVTKSGTNQFKGTVYYYKKSPSLTGLNVGSTKVARQEFDFYNRGASIGGPIIKNKLFFFVSGEQEKQSQPATSRIASRNGAPSSSVVSGARAETLDSLSAFLQEKFGYNPGPYENYNYETKSDKITARLDFNLSSKHTININYYYLKSARNVAPSNSGSPTNGRSASVTGMPFFSSSYVINNNFNIIIGELNSKFSNKVSNKLQVGYNALRDFRTSPGGVFPMVDIMNGQGAALTSFGYEPFTANNKLNTNTWQFNDIVTVFSGKHTFNFGTQNTINKFTNGFAPAYYGIYRFPSVDAFYNSVNNNAPTAIRYEFRYSARKNGEFPFANLNVTQLGFFAQDKWNVNKNFTLTMGLRADIPIFDQNFVSNTNADALTYRDGVKIETGKAPKSSILWSPRVGFNWDVKGDKTVQLRGGAGVFAGPPPFVWLSNQASNNGVDFGSYVLQPGVGGVTASDPRFIFNEDVAANIPQNATANTSYNLAISDKNFKFPQLFRTNLAVDFKIPFDITATVEGIYNKDINAVYHQNINLPSTGTPLLGFDNRIRYSSQRIYSGQGGATAANPNISDAILMKNTNEGYSYNLTLQLQRNVRNLYTMVAYTYGKSKSVNDGGSIAQSIWRDRPVMGDPNADVIANSNFYQPHRIVAAAAYRFEYAKHFATSIGITFEAANAGVASYIYGNNPANSADLNNDGLANDLIYVPAAQDEIILEKASASDPRTTAEIWTQLNAYIDQDDYLKHRRGKYAERNGLLLPWYSKADLNFTQDFFVNVGGKRNTIRFTMDVFNFTNLINKYWGILKTPNRTSPLNFIRVETTGANAGKPVFTFPYLDATNRVPLTSTFQNSTGLGSRYQMQLGVRYIFN
ncbi:MAG: hypothetical protein RL172_675 [Bacteroidota bacterium]